MKEVKTERYEKPYTLNAMSIYVYKSTRKNAKCKHVNVNHLISHDESGKINDDRILYQFIGTIDKIMQYAKQYDHIELSMNGSIFKQTNYINANNELYCTVEDMPIIENREQLYSIEQMITSVYYWYCLIYPYNKLNLKEIHNNKSIRYIINEWYKH